MKTCFICGYNNDFRLGEESNNKDKDDKNIISPPITSKFETSKILSFSTYYHLIVVTTDGVAHGIGRNNDGEISWSLPHETLSNFTDIKLKDSEGRPCKSKSAVCGFNYTLYLILPTSKSGKPQLAYSHSKMETEFPTVLNIGDVIPVSLFGGRSYCAAIDTEGGIIFINDSHHKSPTEKIEKIFLPFNEKASSIACCNGFVISLSTNGHLFESDNVSKPSFIEVSELKDIEIQSISGIHDHCLAVSRDGRVFVRGICLLGGLGLGKDTKKVDKFTEISSFSMNKIHKVYAGVYHSLFQTINGEIFGCGHNSSGQLFLSTGIKKTKIFEPVETTVSDATFCIAGYSTTAVFKNCEPPNNPNKRIDFEKVTPISKPVSSSDLGTETSELKARILELENQLLQKDEEIKRLQKMQSKGGIHEIEILDGYVIDALERLEEISFGSSGKVFKVAKKIIYALKEMKTSITTEEFRQFLQEYELLCHLLHPNIVKTFGIFMSDEKRPPSILLEFCPTNLEKWVKEGEHTKVEIVFFVYEIVEGMKYVHSQKVIHRDLKPTNILIGSDGHIRISDFGISKLMSAEDQSMTGGVGTQRFMAPEILNEEEYNEKVDVYSFGVVLFFILSGGEFPKITVIQVGTGKKAKIPASISPISRELINKCWNFDPKDRPSFKEVYGYLESNDYNLIDMDESEIEEIKDKIQFHKSQIPSY